MKLARIYLYTLLVCLIVWLLIAATSCLLPTSIDPPIDWVYHPPAEPIDIDTTAEPIDTVDIDTIIPEPPDTCFELTEFTDPAFVTLYMKFDTEQDSVLWEGGGIQSYDLAEVVSQITGLEAKIDTSPIGMSVLLKGTNNHQQFQLKVFTRIDGYKWYAGTAMQALILPGSNAAYYKQCFVEYKSYNQFTFFGVNILCDEGIELSRFPLKDCHEGRWYADLFFLPCQPPQSVRDSLDLYGWERVRAIPNKYVTDLRHLDHVTPGQLAAYALSGNQIIVRDDVGL